MDTAEKIFKYFLQGVRKERTVVIKPADWVLFMNGVLLDWVKTKLPETEYMQKRVDDLQAIHVVTDGIQYPMIEISNGSFEIPSVPKYLHGLSASFSYYKGSELVNYSGGYILRSDNRNTIAKSQYRKPRKDYTYFELREGKIYIKTDGTEFNRMALEYYRYPDEFKYTPSVEDSTGSFNVSQNKEIADLAIRKYLERVRDPRHQSFGAENMSVPQ
jgi:hypothetical protein